MSETIMLPTNYELVVKDKATAMQYAISQARVYSENTKCYILNLELAQNIFKLFCDNVNLPDVGNGNVVFVPQDNSNSSMSCDPDFLVNDKQKEDKNKYTKLSDVLKEDSQQAPFNEKTLTYEDVAKELFFNDDELYHYITTDGGIKHSTVYNAYGIPTICTSRKQAEKLLAINRLMNVCAWADMRDEMNIEISAALREKIGGILTDKEIELIISNDY